MSVKKSCSLKKCSFVRYKKSHYYFSRKVTETELIDVASCVLESRAKSYGDSFISSEKASQLISMKLSKYEREVFAVLFLNSKNRLISFEKMFYGTVDSASIYPREVVRKALLLNTCAVIIAHNHPSGDIEPSRADIGITNTLREALKVFDVRLLDHIIVSDSGECCSFAERGLL